MQHNDDVKVTSVKQEKKELAKEDDPAFILYKQFKVARYKLPTLELLNVTDKEWKDVRLTIWQMHKAGVTSDDVYIRTKELLGKWKPEMVTVRSLWKHWDTYASPTYGIVTTSVKIEDWFNDNNG